jgi:hypothetical protein
LGPACLGVAVNACSDEQTDASAREVTLASREGWTLDQAETDPLAAHRDETTPCSVEALTVEATGFEISTEACNYASVTQPALEALHEADLLQFSVWWETLAALEPSEAHLALLVDGTVLWEDHVSIPGLADVRAVEVPVANDPPAESPVTFHLHNHGSNTWKIGDVMLVPSGARSQQQ